MARILITDDEMPMRELMRQILTGEGHEIIEARGAREALKLHGERPADLIITDLVMKDMDGIEMLRRLQASSPGTPVIAISGNKHSTIWLNMAKLIGANRILAKPFSPDELTRAVSQALPPCAPPDDGDHSPTASVGSETRS